MCNRILLLSAFLPVTAMSAAAQEVEPSAGPAAGPEASVAELRSGPQVPLSELRRRARVRALRVEGTGGPVFARLADLLSVVQEHVRVGDVSERLAPDLRLYRQVADVTTFVPGLTGSDCRVRLSVGLGLARLRSTDPLDPDGPARRSRGSIFLSGGLRVEYSGSAGWRAALSLHDRVELERVSSHPAEAGHRAPRRLEGLLLPRAASFGVQLDLP